MSNSVSCFLTSRGRSPAVPGFPFFGPAHCQDFGARRRFYSDVSTFSPRLFLLAKPCSLISVQVVIFPLGGLSCLGHRFFCLREGAVVFPSFPMSRSYIRNHLRGFMFRVLPLLAAPALLLVVTTPLPPPSSFRMAHSCSLLLSAHKRSSSPKCSSHPRVFVFLRSKLFVLARH